MKKPLRGATAAALFGLLFVGACGGGGTTAQTTAASTPPATSPSASPNAGSELCGTPVSPIVSLPSLPPQFPIKTGGLTVTSASVAGPSVILEGAFNGSLDQAFRAFKQTFSTAGFTVTSSEKEEEDAEVNFAGAGTTGQVKLEFKCSQGTEVRITVRPA